MIPLHHVPGCGGVCLSAGALVPVAFVFVGVCVRVYVLGACVRVMQQRVVVCLWLRKVQGDSCGVRTHALADWRLEPAP